MTAQRNQRKVLIIGEDSWVRDNMRVLLGSMGCQCLVASSVQQALPLLAQENPQAAIIDPLSVASSPSQIISGLIQLYLGLHGRVILLTEASADLQLQNPVEHYPVMQISRERLLEELWDALELLFRPTPVLRRITHAARLISDSLLQPLPAGVRTSQPAARRLVYQSASLTVDFWLEPQTDSRRVALVGQLADSSNPNRSYNRVPVILLGRNGPVAFASTSEFGEFHLDFEFEPDLKLEMEATPKQWLSVVLPPLERLANGGRRVHKPAEKERVPWMSTSAFPERKADSS